MKGIIFLGCSFTWGQGLYFYSDLDTVILPENEYMFYPENVSHAQIKYKNKFRFARLVADEFKTFEVCKNINGGSDDHSLEFLDGLFINDFVHEDFSHIVYQISHIFRNNFNFTYDGKNYTSTLDPGHEREKLDNIFWKWYDDKKITVDEYKDLYIKQQIEKIKNKLMYYENLGLKIKIISWEEDVLPYIQDDLFFKKNFVKLTYNNQEYDSISILQNKHKNMTIKFDYDYFGDNPPLDHHPSKLCHQIIANSLIKTIQNDLI